jgi:hypothetical protein
MANHHGQSSGPCASHIRFKRERRGGPARSRTRAIYGEQSGASISPHSNHQYGGRSRADEPSDQRTIKDCRSLGGDRCRLGPNGSEKKGREAWPSLTTLISCGRGQRQLRATVQAPVKRRSGGEQATYPYSSMSISAPNSLNMSNTGRLSTHPNNCCWPASFSRPSAPTGGMNSSSKTQVCSSPA